MTDRFYIIEYEEIFDNGFEYNSQRASEIDLVSAVENIIYCSLETLASYNKHMIAECKSDIGKVRDIRIISCSEDPEKNLWFVENSTDIYKRMALKLETDSKSKEEESRKRKYEMYMKLKQELGL